MQHICGKFAFICRYISFDKVTAHTCLALLYDTHTVYQVIHFKKNDMNKMACTANSWESIKIPQRQLLNFKYKKTEQCSLRYHPHSHPTSLSRWKEKRARTIYLHECAVHLTLLTPKLIEIMGGLNK
jgi:hypothetical protein